jgi:hypothetical protein
MMHGRRACVADQHTTGGRIVLIQLLFKRLLVEYVQRMVAGAGEDRASDSGERKSERDGVSAASSLPRIV